MGKFEGKRALVTGAGAGIGRGIALKLAELGAQVYAIDKNEETLKTLAEEVPKIKTVVLDISNWKKAREVVESLAPIHLVANNAGIIKLSPAVETTEQEFDSMFSVNVKPVMNISQTVAKGLIAIKEKGNIVNTSSVAGRRAMPDHLSYCSSKAAVDMMTKCFALELGPHNIRVNAVSPIVVLTEMGRAAWSDPNKRNAFLRRVPQGHFAEVDDVVNAVVYLLSDESDMINGHSLPIDGAFLVF